MMLAIGGAALPQIVTPPQAQAAGAFAEATGTKNPLVINSESAILSLKDGQEQIDLRLNVTSSNKDMGLIIPTPAPATVTLGATTDFSVVGMEMTPTVSANDRWFSQPDESASTEPTGPSTAAPTDTTDSVAILDRVQLSVNTTSTIKPSDTKALTTWLTKFKYELTPDTTDLLARYADMGWSFTAVRVTSSQLLVGDLSPLRITFESDQLVYPLALAQAATTPQSVTLYALADHRETATFLGGSTVAQQVTWARPTQNPQLQARGNYLTAISLKFPIPASQITDDLKLQQAPNDDETGTTEVVNQYMSLLGIPIGWLIIGVSAVLILAVLLIALIPRRRWN